LTVDTDAPILERGSTWPAPVYSPASRCFDILELLAAEPAGMPLTGVARSLALPKSATHRLLLTLIECGYAAQDPTTQRYRLTFKIATVAFRLLASSTLQDVAQPVLDRLARASGDLARLAVVDGDGMRWVAKAQGAQSGLRYDPEMGLEVALNATGVGRLWLASLPEAQALAILDRYEARARRVLGPNAPRSRVAWLAKMRAVRRRSYAEAMEEGAAGVAAVGAAIRVGHGAGATVVGTVSITGPVSRFGAKRRPMLGRLCAEAAAELAELWLVRAFQHADEQPVLATAEAA
jgi:IclR family transcriptional regulator, acetate operon repressor